MVREGNRLASAFAGVVGEAKRPNPDGLSEGLRIAGAIGASELVAVEEAWSSTP